jgi:hypothetical protein
LYGRRVYPRHKQRKSRTLPIKIERHTNLEENQNIYALTFRKQNTKQKKYLTFVMFTTDEERAHGEGPGLCVDVKKKHK